MRQHLAKLVLLSMPLGGCSLIYSSDRLPAVNDAPPADVEPMKLTLERVSPVVLLEGQGEGGSRPAVLVVHGTNIAAGATVMVTTHRGEMNNASVMVDNAAAVVDAYGQSIAVPITLNVDKNIGASQSIRLDVTVIQAPPNAEIRATLGDDEDPALTLQGLPELEGTPTAMMLDAPLYSRIDATDIPTAGRMTPLILRSTSSIKIGGGGPIALNAAGREPGPGGFRGGEGGPGGVLGPGGEGKEGVGPGGGRPSGGGAGFSRAGDAGTGGPGPVAGEPALTALTTPDSDNRGSGGAGGRGGGVLGGKGGDGGGGGGALELTAGGDLTVMVPIEAKGDAGTAGMGGGTPGGGGSGGVVLLRTGGTLTLADPGVTATGGLKGGAMNAGDGSAGRIRIDAPDPTAMIMSMPAVGYRGPRFDPMTPMIVREEKPKVTFVGQAGALIKYTIEDSEGTTLGPIEIMMPGSGKTTVQLAMPLFRGLNRLCALVTGVTERRDEAENCITLAYLY